jgi:hypothetical protein
MEYNVINVIKIQFEVKDTSVEPVMIMIYANHAIN